MYISIIRIYSYVFIYVYWIIFIDRYIHICMYTYIYIFEYIHACILKVMLFHFSCGSVRLSCGSGNIRKKQKLNSQHSYKLQVPVCPSVRERVCAGGSEYVYMNTCICIYTHLYICTRMCTFIYVYMYANMYMYWSICIIRYKHMWMYAGKYMQMYMYTYW